MAAFNLNLKQGFKDLASPFTNLFKKPATPLFTPAPKPATPSLNYSPAYPGINYTPAPGMAPNASTPQGPRYFAPPVIPQVKAAPPAAPVAQNPPPAPAGAPVGQPQPPVLPPVAPPAPVSAPPRPESPSPEATPPPAPFTPNPAQQAAISSAEATYQKSLQISPEELSTQEDIDKIMADIEKARQSFRLGSQNTSDQPIPMEFITGQLRSMENRALNTIRGFETMAEPLERRLARMQAVRLASTDASKFSLERADKAVESARGESKDIRTETESRRRFGVEQAGAGEGRSIQRESLAQQKSNADRQFEEDNRQFGLDYAIKQRQTAVQELEAATKAAEGKTTGFTPETGAALQLINEILPEASKISGIYRNPFSGTAEKMKQLTANLAVNARKLIKGQGQVSDYEAKILQQSASSLSGGYFSGKLSEGFVEQELKKLRGVINSNAGLEVSVKVTDPNSGQSKVGALGRDDIFDAASKGFIVEYQ